MDVGDILLLFFIQRLKSLGVEANKLCCINGMRKLKKNRGPAGV